MNDEDLFMKGACHVFADELACRLNPHGFLLKRIADLNRTAPQQQALHVFVGKDGIMVDVQGQRSENGFIDEMTRYRLDHNGPVQHFAIIECTRAELFAPVSQLGDEIHGIRNKWGYFLDAEFMGECQKRARRCLERFPGQYGLI